MTPSRNRRSRIQEEAHAQDRRERVGPEEVDHDPEDHFLARNEGVAELAAVSLVAPRATTSFQFCPGRGAEEDLNQIKPRS